MRQYNPQTWLLGLIATEKTNLKDGTMQQLPEKRVKEIAKDRSSVKVLECELHKPADWREGSEFFTAEGLKNLHF